VSFCAKPIFVVCQAVSLAVLLLSAKIQDGRRQTSWKILSGDWRLAISPKRVIQYIHVWFCGGVVGIGGSIGTICVSIKSEMTPMEDTCITRFFITWKKQFSHERQSVF